VNIGGLVMIRLAPVMALAPLAQALLVAIGTVTAVVAALVMTTRVSIKVALAWSTCAQMGFMLVECGLGAWHLALLHLVAHSLYKAHAFLSSGSVVEGWRVRSLARAPGAGRGGVPILGLVIRGLSVVVLYLAWSELFGVLLPRPEPATGEIASLARGVSYGVVLAGLLALLGAQVVLALRPYGRLARALHPTLFAGLYLDELFTRLTFRIWPPRLPSRPGPLHPLGVAPTLEA
jgi:NAD(P)H-quinone oxidoreductase subunit 5